jgi:hypothetical protein
MIEDFRGYVENYYNNINSNEIDKLVNICHNNNYFLKFILLTIKINISILSPKNNTDKWILRTKKQLLSYIHRRKREVIRDYSKKIGNYSIKKNYSEDSEELMESINDKYITMIRNINIINKVIKYLTESKYNINTCLKQLLEENHIFYIEEYSNSS